MNSALVIGCGNIGALYDLDQESILTHAKAYSLHPDFTFSVYDKDPDLSRKISEKYGAFRLDHIDHETLKKFDCVSICTPTPTHSLYLKMAIGANVPVVVCEKPLSDNWEELENIEQEYAQGKSRVLVNYIRRFQPAYKNLKEEITAIKKSEQLHHISIRYHRGFNNNCSHAFDLVSFLTGLPFSFNNPVITHSVNDHFPSDPTLSMSVQWDNTQLLVMGLSGIKFPVFEIELYFEYKRISILNAGNTIITTDATVNTGTVSQDSCDKKIKRDCLKNYMMPVIEEVNCLLQKKTTHDNFLESVELNKSLLKLKRHHG